MIEKIANWLVFSVFKIAPETRLAESLYFFVYDTIKILVLLFFMIGVIAYLRSYIPQDRIKKWLSGKRLGFGNLLASLFGAATPFCSCSSVPIFIGFVEAGIPLGVTLSFLITSPLVNEYLVVIMLGMFGWKITLAYVITGILIGVFAGMIIGKLGMEKYLVKDVASLDAYKKIKKGEVFKSFKHRIDYSYKEASSIVKKIWVFVIIGTGVGAVLHGYIPQELLQGFIAKGGLFAVPLAVIVGVPLYANCAAIVPVAVVLVDKGIPLGTALAFMMATAALSLPEAIILRRVMKLKLIAVFFGIVALGIIFIGYLFNYIHL